MGATWEDYLLAGGYFRILDMNLSSFEKLVGGILWAMQLSLGSTNSFSFVDFNTHQYTLRDKVHLSERIVLGLNTLACPFPIQPHQIQGEDGEALLPVITWLLQKSLYTISQSKQQELDWKRTGANKEYPTRKYYCPSKDIKHGREAIQRCLLEYGETSISGVVPSIDPQTPLERKIDQVIKARERERGCEEARTKEMEEKLLQHRKEIGQHDWKNVNMSILQWQTAEGEDANRVEQYGNEKDVLNPMQRMRKEQHALKKEIERQEKERREQEGVLVTLQETCQQTQTELDAIKQYNLRVQTETDSMEIPIDIEGHGDQLQEQISSYEVIKSNTSAFKQECRIERDALQTEITNLKTTLAETLPKMSRVEAQHTACLSEFHSLRQEVGKKSRAVHTWLRKLDLIPSRLELMQYERRLVELYDESESKLELTRKYFEYYNHLKDKLKVLSRQVDVMDSIMNNLESALANKDAEDTYLVQFKRILVNMTAGLERQKVIASKAYAQVETLCAKHEMLCEQQREYFATIKSFQTACDQNESLVAALSK